MAPALDLTEISFEYQDSGEVCPLDRFYLAKSETNRAARSVSGLGTQDEIRSHKAPAWVRL